MDNALLHTPATSEADSARLRAEFGPVWRRLAARYFEPVRFSNESVEALARLHDQGFVVHIMRTTAWINYLYLTWALIRRGLPPVRAVVNLRRWFTRPWRKTAQRGDFDVRFTYARRHGGSGLVFLKQSAFGTARGKYTREDPFAALVALARKAEKPVFLVPELFVWEKWNQRLKPGVIDFVFGSPEAPGFLHTLLAFFRNYHRAQFRVGEPVNLKSFIDEHPGESDEVIGRKVRGILHHHLAKQTRSVFGPPTKSPDRFIEEATRDRSLRRVLEQVSQETGRRPESLQREARRNLNAIAARYHPFATGMMGPLLTWVFNRIYDGIDVDEAGLERAMKAGERAPIVLVPSHKSHIDYLILGYVLWNRGYAVPLVAAGANLSFFPLGVLLRRVGAFFLRRTFKGDKVYTASFKTYVKKLIHDGIPQEFFPEGGRSRTGKLLMPKLGMLTWQVDAVLEGARNDLIFVPIAIDYEKVVESASYSKELAGGEKQKENLSSLLKAPQVLTARYGRIHLSFDEPISLVDFAASRQLKLNEELSDEQKKGLVRALGNRIMHGISRTSVITPHALAASALLAHRRRGIDSREVSERIGLLRKIAEMAGAPFSPALENAPSSPTVIGSIQDAVRTFCDDGMLKTSEAKGEVIYTPVDERRSEMSFYKNTLMNLVAPISLVANAVLSAESNPTLALVKERALFQSRLFKFEFIYEVGKSFDSLFAETLERLARLGLLSVEGDRVQLSSEPFARPQLEFLADLMRDYLESYLLAALVLGDLSADRPMDKKDFVKTALETGRAEFLSGRIGAAEALSRTTLENALLFLVDQKVLVEKDKALGLAPTHQDASARGKLAADIRAVLQQTRN